MKKLFFNLFIFDQITNTLHGNSNLPDEVQTYYDKEIIHKTEPKLVHDELCKKKDIPKGNSKINFRVFAPLVKALTPLTEGVTPDGKAISESHVEATLYQYGDYIKTTDRISLEALDPIVSESQKLLANQAGRTLDTISREVLTAGEEVLYAPSVNGSTVTAVAARKDIVSTCRLRPRDISLAKTRLARNDARPINGSYKAIIHPDVAFDIRNNDNWIDVHKYKNPENIFHGEIGMYDGVTFYESSEAKIIAPAIISDGLNRLTCKTAISSSSTSVVINETLTAGTPSTAIPVYINGVANTITAIATSDGVTTLTIGTAITSLSVGAMICGTGAGKDGSAVYPVIFAGEDAAGTSSLEGGGLTTIVKPLGAGEDPLNQRATVGWKAWKATCRLVEQYLIRVECTAENGLLAKSN